MMQTALSAHRPAPAARDHRPARASERRADEQFVAMLRRFRGSGGIARAEEVVAMSTRRRGPDVEMLARWIDGREVICFEWQTDRWLPLFQFERADMTPRPQLAPVLAELAPVFDPWELADWFAQPNPALEDRSPVELIASDLPAVLQAARADRSIADG